MMRTRLLAPGFFKNEDLATLDPWARLCFAGLWCLADRQGRLEDRPKRIKAEVFPYDAAVDVEPLLAQLAAANFIRRYAVDGERYIDIPAFLDHQTPHRREAESVIPPPAEPEPGLGRVEHGPRPDLGQSKDGPRLPVSVSVSVYGEGTGRTARDTNTPPRAARPIGRTSGGVLDGSLPRDHVRHAWCGERLCVPAALHGEFVRAWGGDPDAAAKQLHAWYDSVESALPQTPIGDDPFKFWRARFATAFPSPIPQPSQVAGPRRCSHTPRCADDVACTRRELDAQLHPGRVADVVPMREAVPR